MENTRIVLIILLIIESNIAKMKEICLSNKVYLNTILDQFLNKLNQIINKKSRILINVKISDEIE